MTKEQVGKKLLGLIMNQYQNILVMKMLPLRIIALYQQ